MRSRIAAGRGSSLGGLFAESVSDGSHTAKHAVSTTRRRRNTSGSTDVGSWDAHLPQFRYFPDHIVIGSSAFDEASQIPLSPEDVERLSDPSLTTPEFHQLYRRLTGEDRRLPTYLK
jgi:hypothetical protein